TLVIALVFAPLLTLSGLAGKFFAPLGIAYLIAVLASLVVALTVTPALSLLCFGDGAVGDAAPRVQQWIKARYAELLERRLRRRDTRFALVFAIALAAAAPLPFLGGGLLPPFREGHLVLQVSEAPGTALAEVLRVGKSISDALLAIPGIATVEQQVGRAE